MNILVLGNGFDLALGLPTKYTDFLEFVKIVTRYCTVAKKRAKKNSYQNDAELFKKELDTKALDEELCRGPFSCFSDDEVVKDKQFSSTR